MRLELLRLGSIAAIGAPVPGYLIRTEDRCVLVDTGYAPGSSGTGYDFVNVEPGQLITDQLAARGLAAADVDTVICTHLDPDHAGNHGLFPTAEFVVQAEHLRFGRGGTLARLELARASWDRPDVRWREVAGDVELLPGVTLIASGGHVPGHQSVLLEFPAEPAVLLAGDAIPMLQCLDPDRRPIMPFDVDADATRASTARLVELARDREALIVCGHDQRQWLELTTAGGRFEPTLTPFDLADRTPS